MPTFSQYVTNGDAYSTGSCYVLTPDLQWQSGSVWYLNRVDISEPFDLYFEIFLGCRNNDGADGIAFVLQQVSTSVGTQGEGIGYGGIFPSLALEIDTYFNPNRDDPQYDHVSLMRNGNVNHVNTNNLAGPFPAIGGGQNITDCNYHEFRVTWNPDSQIYRAYIDCQLRLEYTGDIINNIFNGDPTVFWGFTSATGGLSNRHEFCLEYVSFTEALRDTAICEGGSISLNPGSGSSFLWTPATGLNSNVVQTPIASPTQTTTYVVEIGSPCNQFRYDTVTIVVQDSILDPLPDQMRLCPGGSLEIEGNIPFSTYAWSTGDSTRTITVTQPGIYTATVTTQCTTLVDQVEVLPANDPQYTVVDVGCNGGNDGQITLAWDAPLPLEVAWRDDQNTVIQSGFVNTSTTTLSGLSAGTYTLVARDTADCIIFETFTLDEPPLLEFSSISGTDIACAGDNTGTITVTAVGGVPPYSFSVDGGGFGSTNTFQNLTAGIHTVTVLDSNGCDFTTTFELFENPLIIPAIIEEQAVTCFGQNSGSLTLAGSGGAGGFAFSLDGSPFQASGSFTGLGAGTYLVQLQDVLGCIVDTLVNVAQPDSLEVGLDDLRMVDCFGNQTASVQLLGSGGQGGYTFSFNGGPFAATDSFVNLAAGAYPIVIQDDSACTNQDTLIITEPDLLDGQVTNILDVDCFGNASGAVTLSGLGGTTPYQFGLDSNMVSLDNVIDSLPAGSYTFYVRDDSSCLDSVTATIAEPPVLTAFVTGASDVDCNGNNTGVLSVAGSGGTPGYEYALLNTGNVGPGYGPTPSFDSLFAGLYTLFVRDLNGCVASVDTSVNTPLGLQGGIDSLTDVACYGDSSGALLMQATGGTTPYNYFIDGVNLGQGPLFDQIPALVDTITLIDANGCIIPIPFQIVQPDSILMSIVEQKDLTCFGDSSGRVRLAAVGGVRNYTFEIIGNPNTQLDSTFSGLLQGAYTFQMTDANGCSVAVSTTVNQPDSLELQITEQQNVDCFGNMTGLLDLTATGGVPDYTFALDTLPFGTPSLFDSLRAGTYIFSVQDDSSCITTQPIEITEPDTLTLDIGEAVDILCFGDSTGSIALFTTGGTQPYSFSLDSTVFQPDSLFEGLTADTYQILVVDDSGCVARVDTQLTEPPRLEASIVQQVDVDCFGNDNGTLEVFVQGGVPRYLYSLDGDTLTDVFLFSDLPPGNYEITVQDDNGCQDLLQDLQIDEPDSLEVNLAKTDVLCFGESSGRLEALAQGGLGSYSFDWSPQNTGNALDSLLENVPIGDYNVLVTDENGCTDTASLQINQPDTLILFLEDLQEAYCDWDNGFGSVRATGGTTPYRYVWEGASPREGASQQNIFGGSYVVAVQDTNGCLDTLTVDVPQVPPATPFFTTSPTSDTTILLSDARILFQNQSVGAVSYVWDLGANGGTTDEINPAFQYQEAGTYEVTLTAYNEYFVCPVDYTVTLEIVPDGVLYIPNAFTPNGDRHNQRFVIKGEGIVDMTCIIFDRWGRQIMTFDSLDGGWNGLDRGGNPAPEGVYTYRVRALFNSGDQVDKAGTVTLIR
ncbi:MAG: gliding motility-associated C-terminal domain-containing protein [Bacteroidota bacterium]